MENKTFLLISVVLLLSLTFLIISKPILTNMSGYSFFIFKHPVFGLWGDKINKTISQPLPPANGPGSAAYTQGAVRVDEYGEGLLKFWIYEPQDPTPSTAPVVVFLHGLGAPSNRPYNATMQHLAKKGFIVIYPIFGTSQTRFPDDERNARQAIFNALQELENNDHVKSNGRYAFAGHSLGTSLSSALAAHNLSPYIPSPEVLILVEPANGVNQVTLNLTNLHLIPKETRLLIIQSERSNVGPIDIPQTGMFIWNNTGQLTTRNFLRVYTDRHGYPPVVADHGLGNGDDRIDIWAFWRHLDKALEETILDDPGNYSVFCGAATPECDPVRFMGTWSDGTPLKRIKNAGDLGLHNN